MLAEYLLVVAVMGILLLGRILSDRIQDQQSWFCFYEQKKMSAPIPRRIMCQQELPIHYQAIFPQQEPLPFMVYIPGSSSVLSPRKEVFIILYDDRFTLYEGNSLSAQEVAFDDILLLEYGRMLFSRWLRMICQHQTYVIRYHVSDDDDFFWMIKKIRFQAYQQKQSVFTHDRDHQRNRLLTPHSPFMSIAQSNLLPEQSIVDTCFQPAYMLKKNICGRFLSTTRLYTPHLSVMTEHELILIQKREPIRTMVYDQYSTKILFIPYQHLQAMTLIQDEKTMVLQLKLSLSEQVSIPLFFMAGNEQVHSFFDTLQETIKNTHPQV